MAGPSNVPEHLGEDGKIRSHALHLGGYSVILWETMQQCGYTEKPIYVGTYSITKAVNPYKVAVTNSSLASQLRGDVSTIAYARSYASGCNLAAFQALGQLGHQHATHTVLAMIPTLLLW